MSGAQIPLALGLVQTFTGAIAKPLRAGDLDTTLPCLEKGLGRGAEMPFFPNDLDRRLPAAVAGS